MSAFLSDFRAAHSKSLAFAAVLPFVAAIPLVAEFFQHVVEMNIGMYAGPDAAEATADNTDRLNAGFLKTIALSLPAYFFIRWLNSGGDKAEATHLDGKALRLFALVIALQALLTWLSLYVWTEGAMAAGLFVFSLIFMPLVIRFVVAAPLGTLVTPLQSIRTMFPHALYAILFPLVAMLPLMALHYALGIGAVFVSGDGLKWAMLVADSFVTAWLALVITASHYIIALRPGPIVEEPRAVAA
ncbi:hypothetical protein [Qipengyuania flava]|uniref:hypothetical protein n=1 Tax=Qipengyuania flava TaxID=192812 RepID=UPI00273D1660|nr:hypothetical protein [Qipengyuania flava]